LRYPLYQAIPPPTIAEPARTIRIEIQRVAAAAL